MNIFSGVCVCMSLIVYMAEKNGGASFNSSKELFLLSSMQKNLKIASIRGIFAPFP